MRRRRGPSPPASPPPAPSEPPVAAAPVVSPSPQRSVRRLRDELAAPHAWQEGELQFVVISLKDNFYERAHGLVGIYRDVNLECSRTVTLNLEEAAADVEEEVA